MTVPARRPSEVVWSSRDEVALGPVPGCRRAGVPETAARILAGEQWRPAVRELIDGLRDDPSTDLTEPAPVTAEVDAYLAALVEHTCASRGRPAPAWVEQPHRFLSRFWWPSDNEALRAVCLAQSPAAFRRRGIFIGATTLERV